MGPLQLIADQGVAIIEIIRCPAVQGEGESLYFHIGAYRWEPNLVPPAAVLAWVFDNGWIMIPF